MTEQATSPPPLVSIAIPCHNAERWLQECLDSALGQTYRHKEVLVVDDGSTDNSVRVLEKYAGRIRYETGPNRGANAARNRLLEMSQGSWIQYLDADDYLLPEKLSKQIAFAMSHPDVDIVYSPCVLLLDTGQTRPNPVEDTDPVLSFIRWNFTTHGLLFRRTALTKVGGWKEGQPCCQENELLLRLFRAEVRFGLVDAYDAVYRFHNADSVSRRFPERVIRQRARLIDEFEAMLSQRNQLSDARRKAVARARFEMARSMYPADKSLARELMAKVLVFDPDIRIDSRACPRFYRLALKLFGFDAAEGIASVTRRLRSRRRQTPSSQ